MRASVCSSVALRHIMLHAKTDVGRMGSICRYSSVGGFYRAFTFHPPPARLCTWLYARLALRIQVMQELAITADAPFHSFVLTGFSSHSIVRPVARFLAGLLTPNPSPTPMFILRQSQGLFLPATSCSAIVSAQATDRQKL